MQAIGSAQEAGKLIVFLLGAETRSEYIAKQRLLGREIPPCVYCSAEEFVECRDHDMECVAFRQYKKSATFTGRNLSRLKRKIRTRDVASVRRAAA